MTKNEKRPRDPGLDLLRVVAIILVVWNHTRGNGFSLYAQCPVRSADYWLSLFTSVLCKAAVPAFFMISGATLLRRDEGLGELYKRRVLRYVLVILVFTLLQYLRIVRVRGGGFNPWAWILYSYCGNVIEPYWFLKAYLSFLVALPVLRAAAGAMGERHYSYLFALKGAQTAFSLVFMFTGYQCNLSWPLLDSLVFYPLAGLWLYERRRVPKRGACVFLCAVTALAATGAETVRFLVLKEHSDAVFTLLDWLIAALLFLSCRRLDCPRRAAGALSVLGGAVFGTYLIEDVARNQLEFLCPLLSPYVGRYAGAVAFTLLSAFAGLFVIAVVRAVPIARKLI